MFRISPILMFLFLPVHCTIIARSIYKNGLFLIANIFFQFTSAKIGQGTVVLWSKSSTLDRKDEGSNSIPPPPTFLLKWMHEERKKTETKLFYKDNKH